MECRLVLNDRTENGISNKDMLGWYHQQLKYWKFRRVRTKNGRSVFYLFFRREEDTYEALRTARSMREISLVRYLPSIPVHFEPPFRPFPPQQTIDLCRFTFRCHLNQFVNEELYKKFIQRLSEQIMVQRIKIEEIHERIEKLKLWWSMNNNFSVTANASIQKLLDIFFG